MMGQGCRPQVGYRDQIGRCVRLGSGARNRMGRGWRSGKAFQMRQLARQLAVKWDVVVLSVLSDHSASAKSSGGRASEP